MLMIDIMNVIQVGFLIRILMVDPIMDTNVYV